ncbi:hypothetical protein PC119_g7096 [Phytophthora cactorum]|uniref:Uncharacterized protein n=1 Tax=Phytophthora cactorum TaxID=29920 RepID=A0A8T1BEE0_9STRA|nr:hypothetical protein PC111_g19711 [Phytophthora cactorum]KAG3247062.1 hypothetical protein PI124_g8238 [Phytophthora idaei]KAG2826193.1 hypothetical protein PC112_g9384 [Phytophthora cactorum]KAG2900274.1 hypothetical protein PC117_g22003 [Phytophthora cactorum]KAG3027855.1 hypothetical protein PC120_g5204 [Phytophthora cactorum]
MLVRSLYKVFAGGHFEVFAGVVFVSTVGFHSSFFVLIWGALDQM